MMRAIFKNKESEEAITRKGYAVISSLVPNSVCDELTSFFEQTDSVDSRGFTISNWNNNTEYRTLTYNKVCDLLLPLANTILDNYKPVMAVYTVKRAGVKSDMLLHQDWSLVDETKCRSVSIWVALCDMTPANGNLQVAEYSHRYAAMPRGMNVPVPFENIRGQLHEKFLTDVPLKKGDAIVFEHRLIHASPQNQTDKMRLAAVIALIPVETDLVHYYKHPGNESELEVLKMDDRDFCQIDFFDAPNKPKHIGSLGMVPAVFRQIEVEEVIATQAG